VELIGSGVIAVAAAVAIYGASLLFVNGIEWVGRRLGLGESVTGALLAALGTALPETMITLVAVATGGGRNGDIGVGTALGGPLALSIVGYGVYALARRWYGRGTGDSVLTAPQRARLVQDQMLFLVMFGLQLALGLVGFEGKRWTAIGFLFAYGCYVWRVSRSSGAPPAHPPPALWLARRTAEPPLMLALSQTACALVIVGIASHFFVDRLALLGAALGFGEQTTGLLLSPFATELPEVLNTVIWVRRGKGRMSLANISGAMMVQAAAPAALGLGFTSWRLTPGLLIAGGVTMLATLIVLLIVRSRAGASPTDAAT
jgi:cation:H+ antiporter